MMELTTVSETQVRNTPSALYNNLSCSGSVCCYAHQQEVILVRPLGPQKLPIPEGSKGVVSCTQLFTAPGDRLLVFVGVSNTVVVFDVAKEHLLCKVTVETEVRTVSPIVTGDGRMLLLVGQSSGAVVIVELSPDFATSVVSQLEEAHAASVTAASAAADSPALFATGDNSGALRLWSPATLTPFVAIPSVNPSTECVTSVVLTGPNFVAATYGCGKIRLFLPSTGEMRVEINAHSRWIQAMALQRELMLLATTGDDGIVAVWQLPTPQNPRAGMVGLKQLRNALCTGVAFNQEGTAVIVATFDNDKLVTYGLPAR